MPTSEPNWDLLNDIELRPGSHGDSYDTNFCAVEAYNHVKGLYHGDRIPGKGTLAAALRTANDCLGYAERQLLKRYLPRIPDRILTVAEQDAMDLVRAAGHTDHFEILDALFAVIERDQGTKSL